MSSTKLRTVASVLLPALAPAAVTAALIFIWSSGGPASASASDSDNAAPLSSPIATVEGSMAAEKAAFAKLVREAAGKEVGPSPFLSGAVDAPVLQIDPVVEEAPVPPAITVPDLVLRGIVSGPRPVAQLGGRMRQVGDEVAPGWILVEIRPGQNEVVIRHAEAGDATIRLQGIR